MVKWNQEYSCVDANEWFPRRYLSFVWCLKFDVISFTDHLLRASWLWIFAENDANWEILFVWMITFKCTIQEMNRKYKFTAGVKSWFHCANIACSPTGPSIALFTSESFIFCTQVSLHLLPFAILPPVKKMKERNTKLSLCEVTHLVTS